MAICHSQALLDITHNSDANVSDDEDEDAFYDDAGDDMISATALSHDDVDMEFADDLTIPQMCVNLSVALLIMKRNTLLIPMSDSEFPV
ncbi:hypothetical protein K503DRAFT_773761 [Rhizopogon vinicolor AM-OR11-026]|uniref:Uncharacterized protein n=1 Tax=Rhizopogon vinicolor AM-OR11-026 TaxID=1314800 RepID=A0A1B7MRF0_9AGAM|nr:hypothetical protein K503DRAFT_773761 [Rhizopogon vinicolor AM-OR11-026]